MTSQLTVNDAINALDKKGKKGGKKAAKKSGKSNVNESVSSGTEETIVPKDSLEGILEVGIKKIENIHPRYRVPVQTCMLRLSFSLDSEHLRAKSSIPSLIF